MPSQTPKSIGWAALAGALAIHTSVLAQHHDPSVSRQRALFAAIEPQPDPVLIEGGRYLGLEFLRTASSTCGRYLLAKVTVPPGGGPPPHIHHWTDEWFYTPDGGAVMFMGEREYRSIHAPPDRIGKDTVTMIPMEKDALVYGPRHYIHGYLNATDRPLVMYIVWRPDTPEASILGYFLEIAKPLFRDPELNAPESVVQNLRSVSLARKYGMNFSTSFWDFIADIREPSEDGAGGHHADGNLAALETLLESGNRPCK